MHDGVNKNNLSEENLEALIKGFENLKKHIENIKKFGVPPVIAVNKFVADTDAEVEKLIEMCKEENIDVALCDVWGKGGQGGIELAEKVVAACEKDSNFKFIYDSNESIKEKLDKIAKEIYGADGVKYTAKAEKEIKMLEDLDLDKYPICMAKTQYSLSDDPALLGRPEGFDITVREVRVSAGAGFIVALTGEIMVMPGLPKVPAAEKIDVDEKGVITGLF